MAIPTNQTAATAIAMTLPYTATQIDIDLATPTPQCDVWYSYTAAADGVVGMLVENPGSILNYYANLTVWVGPVGSLALYLGGFFALQWPIYHSVAAGTTYYYRVRNHWLFTPDPNTSIDISFLPAPAGPLSVGAILINDDSEGFPAAILSQTTGLVTSYVVNVVAGEAGDVLPTGEILLEDVYASPAPTVNLYTPTVEFVQSIDIGALNGWFYPTVIRTHNPSNKWYVGVQGQTVPATDAFVTTVNADGTIGGTTWTLPSIGLVGLSVNNAETILYYTGQGTVPPGGPPSTGGVLASPVQRWDLVNDLPLSDLAAGVVDYFNYDTMVLADDTILQLYIHTSETDAFVRRYSTAGAVLNTYTIPVTNANFALPRLAYASNPATFWLMWVADDATPGLGIIQNIRISDGAIITDLRSYLYSGGEFSDWNPVGDRFGRSGSCPFLILRGAAPGAGSETEVLIPRRLRRAPHLSTEQLWNFYHQFQLDLETGLGTTTGQGVDPQIMLRYSDDGGHTWSHDIFVSAGPLGQYKRRAIWRRLGRSRDRIFEIVYSEPTPLRLVNAYLQVTGGTS